MYLLLSRNHYIPNDFAISRVFVIKRESFFVEIVKTLKIFNL